MNDIFSVRFNEKLTYLKYDILLLDQDTNH